MMNYDCTQKQICEKILLPKQTVNKTYSPNFILVLNGNLFQHESMKRQDIVIAVLSGDLLTYVNNIVYAVLRYFKMSFYNKFLIFFVTSLVKKTVHTVYSIFILFRQKVEK